MGPMSESTASHRRCADQMDASRSVGCAVLTVSDTRTLDNDASGDLIARALEEKGHRLVARGLVRDEPAEISRWLEAQLAQPDVQAILTTGGTGVARRDTTIDVVTARLTVALDGFGELFRMLSWEQVGPAAMLSRATAGLVIQGDRASGRRTLIFCMPGSRNAVETAMTRLIAPELSHLVWELCR